MSAASPQPSRRSVALRAFQIVASAGLLAWVIGRVDLQSVRAALGSVDLPLWTAGIALMLAAPLVGAERTRVLLLAAGAKLRWGQVAAMNLEATYFSVVLPGELVGGVVRWARVRKKLASGSGALALLLVERVIDTIVLGGCTLLGAAWLFGGDGARAARWITASVGLAIVLGAGAFLVAARSAAAQRFCHALVTRHPSGWTGRLAGAAASILDGIASAFEDKPALRRVVLLSAAFWALAWIGGVLVARAVVPDLPPHAFVGASAAIALLSQLPVTFAGLGLREASLPVLLAAYGVTRELGLLLGLCMFVPYLLLAIAGGVLHALGKTAT